MKNLSILLIALLMVNSGMAQSCLPQGITFNWQADVDNFQNNYPGCTQIQGDVTMSGSDITNLNGLSVLTSIGGTLSIYVGALASLTGLENLTSIGDGLIIQNNDSLRSLTGLENLTSVHNLWFSNNKSLASLAGLDHLTFSGTPIWIVNNNNLSACAIQSICIYLSGTGTAWIENNSSGCNSRAEVEKACGVGFDENTASENNFYIYPNPSSTTITIKTPAIGSISILNLSGQKLVNHQTTKPKTQIDISTLPSGVYIIRLISNNTVEVAKLIKE